MYNNPRFNGNHNFNQFNGNNDGFSDFKRPFNRNGGPRLPYRHYLQPPPMLSESLILPSAMQPPPMFGPRGATLPPRNLNSYNTRNDHFQSETSEYWCETCDRNFKSSAQLESHKSEHEQCKIDGCQFIAHPKVITKHIQMQHSNGLFKKIAKLSNPEEIQKWIEERKKRYPTQSNIEKKNLQKEERKKRGEKMEMTKRTFNSKPGSKPYERRDLQATNRNRRPNKNKKQSSQVVETKTISKDNELMNKNIKAFRGIHEIIMRDIQEEIQPTTPDQIQIEDDETEVLPHIPSEKSSTTFKTGVQNVCGALVNLMASYASEDEEPMETIKANLSEKQNSKEKNTSEDCHRTVADEGSENEAPCEIKNDSAKQNISEDCPPSPPRRKRIRKNNLPKESNSLNLNNRFKIQRDARLKRFSRTPSTLLEKLLAKEIKHERNVVLQCIRYIVKNQYFDEKPTLQS